MKSHQKLSIARGSVNPSNTEEPVPEAFRPGDRVVVLDMFGKPTGIYCTVKEA
ncbi:MAG: hypothetical protein QOD84_1940, partial [Acidobacteriaceae bacterium]